MIYLPCGVPGYPISNMVRGSLVVLVSLVDGEEILQPIYTILVWFITGQMLQYLHISK